MKQANTLTRIFLILSVLAIAALIAGCAGNTAPAPEQENNQPPVVMPSNTEETPIVDTQPGEPEPQLTPPPVIPETTILAEASVSLSDLAAHNTAADCWVGYAGEAYDVTSFLPRHPGGVAAISKYCGTAAEFEKGFTKKHGTSKVGTLKKQGLYKGKIA